MSTSGDKIQALMNEFYNEWQKEENRGKSKWDVLDNFSVAHQIAVVFGNFNHQVENGGTQQWIYNGYFHDDAEKLTGHLEIGTELDERCRTILDMVYKLDQYAQETDCDQYGYYRDYDDEDSENAFIGDMANCDAFDTWYYAHCGKDDWWQTVSGIIDKAEGREVAPDREDERGSEHKHPTLRVYIENVHDESIGGFTIPLPAKLEELQGFLEASEITGWQDAEILQVQSDIKGLGETATDATKKTMSPEMLDELNYLAARLEGMGNNEYKLFTAALKAKRHCGSIAEIINLTENLGNFALQPAFSPAEYGAFHVNLARDEYADIMEGLEQSMVNPSEREFFAYIAGIESHIDLDAYGKWHAENEGGVFTENGYLTEDSAFSEVYRGSMDIPDEYRIFTKPGEIYKPPMKLDGEDIAETLIKIKAVYCENISGTAELLRTISNGQDRDYLLMVNKDRVFITPAIEAYKQGELAEKTIHHWAQMPGTSFFALRVMERGESYGQGMTGDFVELNVKALLSNLDRHIVIPERIDAVKPVGFSRSYDLAAWTEVTQSQRNELESYTPRFPADDLAHAAGRYASFMGANEMSSKAVSPDTFLSAINVNFMATAENPQTDMLRITNEAAKQLLARGDTEVFRLTPAGAEKLAPIEAAKALSFSAHRELAIKREDISGLDKWAKSAVKELQRQNERSERGNGVVQ